MTERISGFDAAWPPTAGPDTLSFLSTFQEAA